MTARQTLTTLSITQVTYIPNTEKTYCLSAYNFKFSELRRIKISWRKQKVLKARYVWYVCSVINLTEVVHWGGKVGF